MRRLANGGVVRDRVIAKMKLLTEERTALVRAIELLDVKIETLETVVATYKELEAEAKEDTDG